MATRSSLALACAAVALAAVVAEVLVRMISPQAIGLAPPMYVADNVLVHRLWPGYSGDLRSGEYHTQLIINDRGFRGAAWRTDAPRRVLILGDSFTFGYGVEEHEAFPFILQEALGPLFAVFNAGVPGYGTLQERVLAERLLPEIKPQVVVLGFTVGSDVQDNLEQRVRLSGGYEVRDGFLVQKGTPSGTPLPFKAWLQQRSHLYVLLQRARVRASVRQVQGPPQQTPCAHFLAAEPCGDMAQAWELTLETIRDIGELCSRSGARFIVVAIPHPVQVDDRMWQEESARISGGANGLDRYAPQRKLADLCNAIGATFIDPVPTMRGRYESPLYYRLDRHLTSLGHALIATTLTPDVRVAMQSLERIVDTRGPEVPH